MLRLFNVLFKLNQIFFHYSRPNFYFYSQIKIKERVVTMEVDGYPYPVIEILNAFLLSSLVLSRSLFFKLFTIQHQFFETIMNSSITIYFNTKITNRCLIIKTSKIKKLFIYF